MKAFHLPSSPTPSRPCPAVYRLSSPARTLSPTSISSAIFHAPVFQIEANIELYRMRSSLTETYTNSFCHTHSFYTVAFILNSKSWTRKAKRHFTERIPSYPRFFPYICTLGWLSCDPYDGFVYCASVKKTYRKEHLYTYRPLHQGHGTSLIFIA